MSIYLTIIDGTYVKNNIMDKISYFYNKYFKDENILKYIHAPEEKIFSTIACNLSNNISESLIFYGHSLTIKNFNIIKNYEKYFFIKNIERNMNNEIRIFYNKLINNNE